MYLTCSCDKAALLEAMNIATPTSNELKRMLMVAIETLKLLLDSKERLKLTTPFNELFHESFIGGPFPEVIMNELRYYDKVDIFLGTLGNQYQPTIHNYRLLVRLCRQLNFHILFVYDFDLVFNDPRFSIRIMDIRVKGVILRIHYLNCLPKQYLSVLPFPNVIGTIFMYNERSRKWTIYIRLKNTVSVVSRFENSNYDGTGNTFQSFRRFPGQMHAFVDERTLIKMCRLVNCNCLVGKSGIEVFRCANTCSTLTHRRQNKCDSKDGYAISYFNIERQVSEIEECTLFQVIDKQRERNKKNSRTK